MNNELKDLSLTQHIARALFALGLTIFVVGGTYFFIRWGLGVG